MKKQMQLVRCTVNGREVEEYVDVRESLLDMLRNRLGLTSVKKGCEVGECGACTVIIDGETIDSCIYLAVWAEGKNIRTLEGLEKNGELTRIQEAFIEEGAIQCGFCTPGFIVSAKALLDHNPKPTREQVRDWFQDHRNACRCTGYKPLVDAVMDAAAVMRGEKDAAELEYKEPAHGAVWGTRRPRPSTVARVTGTALYGADMADKLPPDTLHLALAQATVSHANIRGIDTSEAERMPGVAAVLTAKDV